MSFRTAQAHRAPHGRRARVLELDTTAVQQRLLTDAAQQDERDDVLCHPLVLSRWRDQLAETLLAFAAAAGNPHCTGLHDLTLQQTPRTPAQLEQLHCRRRLFAARLQRRAEAIRLITSLNDALSVAERRDPSYAVLKHVADQAYNELVRRYPEQYRHIRARLSAFETRASRLQISGSRTELRRQIFEELDRRHSG
ncbi:hypothetical protein [Streptomyces lonegramiae]|uniref:Uncharacterized protein n=1 Tax=Streptomyces lonegramiae TaxID=3075524 RepID=A0ABU2XP14_9ACTN|nr:hypothetical protein [Streptomyces sp. DSM 41529]MDT0547668.1 hypothetical protein [Streptomyces sp. DSM 41529]